MSCPNKECKLTGSKNLLCKCDKCDVGSMIIYQNENKGRISLNCNICENIYGWRFHCLSYKLSNKNCEKCQCTLIKATYKESTKDKEILEKEGCLFCSDFFADLMENGKVKKNFPRKGKGKKRGGKR